MKDYEYTLLEIFFGFCKNIAWKKINTLGSFMWVLKFVRRHTHTHVYAFFSCYQHFARVSLIGIRAGCLFMGRFLHIYACKTHIHTGSCYIRRQPHSYNALLSTVITAHNKTNYCFLISPTALLPLSPNPRPVQTAHFTVCRPPWSLALAPLLHI